MTTEAPVLSIQFGKFRFHVGAGPTWTLPEEPLQTLKIAVQCTTETWPDVVWPSDDEIQKLLGLPVRFLEGGPGQYEALYAVGEAL